MKHEIRFSGSGGQGVILASVLLGEAASLHENKFTVQSQAYGPEARGGASKADVIIADAPVRYPKARNIDYMVSLTQKAVDKYKVNLKPGGLLIIDSDFMTVPEGDYTLLSLPLTTQAHDVLGKLIALNIVSLGALVEATKIVSVESIEKAVLANVPKGTEEFNLKALHLGRDLVKNLK